MIATALPFAAAVPLLMGTLLLVLRSPVWLRRTITLGTSTLVLGYAGLLILVTRGGAVLAHPLGLWETSPGEPVVAIPFAADMFSALMLAVTALLTLLCVAYGMVAGDDEQHYFQPMVLMLLAGVSGVVLTADLFNLFVFIEVMLLPSYVLMSMLGGGHRLRAGRLYVTYNLFASGVLLAGVAFVYGVAGTVNFAELAGAGQESTAVAVAAGVLMVALGMKAAVVPVHGWLSNTYPDTSPALSALFSGLHTKVAIYAIYRLYALIYGGDDRFLGVAVAIMVATMVIGVLGAVGESTMRSILTLHMVSQIGYILLGLALFGPLGLAAGIFYLLHNTVVKGALFLATGAVEQTYGTQRVYDLGGVARKEPLVAFAFVGAALALTGIPPFSGFAAKYLLLHASISAEQYGAAVAIVLVSLFTLLSMIKIWSNVFWGPLKREPESHPGGDTETSGTEADSSTAMATGNGSLLQRGTTRTHARAGAPLTHVRLAMIIPALVLTLLALGIGLGAQGLLVLTQEAASGLIDTSTYVEAVIGQ
ncbi:monovalent cation/H+ antiporter subunit D family protein [Lipingzhangella sp. LS1_29]|uniref:Monovalent cation/H+ antiporter subunit D family protein n=1 Tax=Lipingzhangella rawalii TaxID=2055835 RepID=A0ABU2H4I6_9ACTN|nr:monovalent cation/H+ antiporter subunit D family protein [Lipingzhangella rawalii]MDS1269912.1 monovalent cation/H+ antiporter subunit D family protein [Lipingzhangella rawalii]